MHAIALSIARAPEPNGSKAAGDLLCHPSQQGLSSAHHLPLASLHPTLAAVRRTIEQPLARPRFPKMRIGVVRGMTGTPPHCRAAATFVADGAVLDDANSMMRFEDIGAGDGIRTDDYDEVGRARRAF